MKTQRQLEHVRKKRSWLTRMDGPMRDHCAGVLIDEDGRLMHLKRVNHPALQHDFAAAGEVMATRSSPARAERAAPRSIGRGRVERDPRAERAAAGRARRQPIENDQRAEPGAAA
jgi:hypothetical protein